MGLKGGLCKEARPWNSLCVDGNIPVEREVLMREDRGHN